MSLITANPGNFLFIGIPGSEIDAQTEKLLTETKPVGVCLFARNIKSLEQTRELTDALRTFGVKIISIDQEGGLVDRLRRVLSPMPAADKLLTTSDAFLHGQLIGQSLSLLGINMDFAPVVDISTKGRSTQNGILTRTFGTDPDRVADMAEHFLNGLRQFGVTSCLKHFPGLGKATVDSHEELPFVEIDDEAITSQEVVPYHKIISNTGVDAVMVAHAAFPGSQFQETDDKGRMLPSSLNKTIITGLLRQRIGFRGLVVSDDMEMGAIIKNYGIGDASVLAINAGTDLVAVCAGVDSIYRSFEAIKNAMTDGRISNETVLSAHRRLEFFTSNIKPTLPFDLETLQNIKQDISLFSERLNKQTGG